MKFSILTWNIWSQDLPWLGWSRRRNLVLPVLQNAKTDFICLQEVRWPWMKDLEAALPDYKWVGTARDSTRNSESTPVFYHHNSYTLLQSETIWLSERPDLMSRGWDALCPHTATICRFHINAANKEITLVNTHLDHWGPKSRELGATLIRTLLERLPADHATLIAGDFNSGLLAPACRILMQNGFLQDSAAGDARPSWKAWAGLDLGLWKSRLDYILYRNMTVLDYQLVPGPRGWPPASDHEGVRACLELLP